MISRISWCVRAILFLVLCVATAVGSSFGASDRESQLYAEAKKEGQVTWYTGHYDAQLAAEIGNAFMKKYPGVKANVLKVGSQVLFQRLQQDLKAGAPQSDVFSSTDISHYVYLKQQQAMEKYIPENEAKIVKAFRAIDPDGYYHVTWAGIVAITYNTKVRESDAPKTWRDLLASKWTNRIGLGNPNYSGMVGVWVVAMNNLYGWQYFKTMNQLKPLIGRSIDDTVTMLDSGERLVAAGDPASTLRSAAKGNPLGVVYPADGAIAVIGPSAIIKGAKNPNAAKLFMEFLLSEENMRLVSANFEQSLRPDVRPPAGAKPLNEIKVVLPTVKEITEGIPVVKEKWRETFGI